MIRHAACVTALSAALGAIPMAAPAGAAEHAILVYSAGLEAMLVDEKDRGLRDAIAMLDQRLAELPFEVPGFDVPPPVIDFLIEMMHQPVTLHAAVRDDADPAAEMPFEVRLWVTYPDQRAARVAEDRLTHLLEAIAPMPVEPWPQQEAFTHMPTPAGDLVFGRVERDGAHHFLLAFNAAEPTTLPVLDRPMVVDNVPAALLVDVDFRRLGRVIDQLADTAPEMEMVRQQWKQAGLLGEDAMIVRAAYGAGEEQSYLNVRVANAVVLYREHDLLPENMLRLDDLRLVPRDATSAQLSRSRLTGIGTYLDEALVPLTAMMGASPFEMIEAQTGIHPQRDVFDHLGELVAAYTSDTTGGGGMLSAVYLVEVADRAALLETMQRIQRQINALAQQHARGYVRLKGHEEDGRHTITLTFPGLPVPLELSIGLTDRFLVAAATPGALEAAIRQIERPASSIVDHPGFMTMGGGEAVGAMQVQFVDTPRLAGRGYGLASLGFSALRNAMRSPAAPEREPRPIMPPYHELIEDARASVMITRIDGEDIVAVGRGDRSAVVNATATVGMLSQYAALAIPAAAAGAGLPALHQARGRANELRASTHLRQLGVSIAIYAADNRDRMPHDLDSLVESGLYSPQLLESPFGPVPDGRGDYWYNNQSTDTYSEVTADLVLAYDRAMYATRGTVAVLFGDGRVEVMPAGRLDQLTGRPVHEGVDFDLPGRWR